MSNKENKMKKLYRDLETKVLHELTIKVNNSDYLSKFIKSNAIKVCFLDYVELVLINNKLTFLDDLGYHYSIFTCNLDYLIDILEEN